MGRILHNVFGDDWGVRSLDGYTRPASRENRDAIAKFAMVMAGGFLLLGFSITAVIWVIGTDVPDLEVGPALVTTLVGLTLVYPILVSFQRLPLPALHLLPPIATVVVVGVGLQIGRNFETAVVLGIVIVTIVVSVAATLRVAMLHLVHVGVGYGIVLAANDAPAPVARWAGVMGGAVIVASVVEWLVGHNRALAAAEHAASAAVEQARAELTELNRTLEVRVAEQVADLDRLGELQRFLPATLVEAVLSGDQSLLEPHRSEVAVFFCDLRGFTAFATSSQPEDVHEMLDGYFALLGDHAQRHGATVGAFTGDGIMAFFNDPLPVADPAGKALAMALELQDPMCDLLGRWQRVGHDIGFGVGIALGYANIGMIGFEGRRDYTALGPVVNLASRLCAEAPSGGILLDPRAGVAVEGTIDLGEPVLVHLKGFERTVEAVPVLRGFAGA